MIMIGVMPACAGPKPALGTTQSNNAEFPVEHLFSHDGCDLYRFYDAGYHWYAKCVGPSTPSVTTITPKPCGKGCVRDEVVSTSGH